MRTHIGLQNLPQSIVKERLVSLVKEKQLTKAMLKRLLLKISDPWEDTRGILRHKKINALRYQKKMRQQWER